MNIKILLSISLAALINLAPASEAQSRGGTQFTVNQNFGLATDNEINIAEITPNGGTYRVPLLGQGFVPLNQMLVLVENLDNGTSAIASAQTLEVTSTTEVKFILQARATGRFRITFYKILSGGIVQSQAREITLFDEAGWTPVRASPDTRKIYVSSFRGNDSNPGLSPELPKRSLAAGFNLLRSGYPDHLYLEKGSEFYDGLGRWDKSGRSASEPLVVTSFGAGPRPIFMLGTNTNTGIGTGPGTPNFLHVIGLDFYGHKKDPSSPQFDPSQTIIGFDWLSGGGNALVEDCRFRYAAIRIQELQNGTPTNFLLRRNVITDVYPFKSHSVGIFTKADGLILEENIFDHNGWHPRIPEARANPLSHNAYITAANDSALTENIFTRGASMAVKFRSDATGSSQRVTVTNNFAYDGEFGFGIGGNPYDSNLSHPARFVDFNVSENVLYHIGRSNPTNRGLAWGIDIQDHVNSDFKRNYFIRMSEYGNSYGIHLNGRSQSNVRVEDNFMYNIQANGLLISNNSSGSAWTGVSILRNLIQNPFNALRLAQLNGNINGITLSNNRYYRNSGPMGRINNSDVSATQWFAQTGETNSQFGAVALRDPTRTLETYMQSIGKTPTVDEFLTSIRGQQKGNWDTRLTAAAINAYFKEGYSPVVP